MKPLRPVVAERIEQALAVLALSVAAYLLWRLNVVMCAFFVAYVLLLPGKQQWRFARNWAPFIVGVVYFNILRGSIYQHIQSQGRTIFSHYAIALDRSLLRGHVAPEVFQALRTDWLDWLAFSVHASHFLFFLVFAVVAWRHDERAGRWLQRTMLGVFVLGLLGYYFIPTVPPWLAAESGMLPPIPHVANELYTRLLTDGQVKLVDTNPVAAMPSLHVAFPAACAAVGWYTFGRRAGLALWAYVAAQSVGVMYLGEHYLIDVVAGLAVALCSAWVTQPFRLREPSLSPSVEAHSPERV